MPSSIQRKLARKKRIDKRKSKKGKRRKVKEELVLFRGEVRNSDLHYYFEKRPLDVDPQHRYGFGPLTNPLPSQVPFRPPIYAVGWGWNSGGRAGNVTEENIYLPRQVQRSITRNYIAAATGKHHSLIVCDRGVVYSFGEGTHGQLGYGNPFTDTIVGKGGLTQAYPRAVTPSGVIKYGHDMKVSQVGCGHNFSVAREVCTEEGVDLYRGLREMEVSLKNLKHIYCDSTAMSKAWSAVRQERFKVGTISEGLVSTWGTGFNGQLGLGPYVKFSPSPTVIPKLRGICIVQISAGQNHVLAISETRHLYSWGSGKSGKLGHGDFDDRWTPEIVKFFLPCFVESCSAGERHSGVLFANRKAGRGKEAPRISMFGRGAHGRLGNGKNINFHTPQLVKKFMPSIEDMRFIQIACGGAHTMVLATKSVPMTLSNPWGAETAIIAFGYGANGQLGTGYSFHSFTPVKVRMPKCVVIAEIACGRSWSLARSVLGQLYSWGKGLRGQLGQGKVIRFSLSPRLVDAFAPIISLTSGYAHSVCLGVPKKHLKPAVALKKSVECAIKGDVFSPIVNSSLIQTDCESLYGFECCRRQLGSLARHRQRYTCQTCKLDSVCFECTRLCHRGHQIFERRLQPEDEEPEAKDDEPAVQLSFSKVQAESSANGPKKSKPSVIKSHKEGVEQPACLCGLFYKRCRVMPDIAEVDEEREKPFLSRESEAVVTIQAVARKYNRLMREFRKQKTHAQIVREVTSNHYYENILKPIWKTLDRCSARHSEERQLVRMQIEDDQKHKYDYNYYLQGALGSMDAMLYGVKVLLGKASPLIPRVEKHIVTDQSRASFLFSWASAREIQLKLDPSRRVPQEVLAQLTKMIPRFSRREGQYHDPDVPLFSKRYIRDVDSEKWRAAKAAREKAEADARAKVAQEALDKLLASKFGTKDLLARAAAILRPVPPAGPPPREAVRAAAREARLEEKRLREAAVWEAQRLEDAKFDVYSQPHPAPLRRRHSITDPCRMYGRVTEMRSNIELLSYVHRRNSLPTRLTPYHPAEKPTLDYVVGVNKSLSMFSARRLLLDEQLDPQYAGLWQNVKRHTMRTRIKRILGYAWLNPRLPVDMYRLLLDGQRRRTISEPERLSKQLNALFETRNSFSKLRQKAKKENKMAVRRRSFDLGEEIDNLNSVNDLLGYKFEEPYKLPSMAQMRKDGVFIDSRIIIAGFDDSSSTGGGYSLAAGMATRGIAIVDDESESSDAFENERDKKGGKKNTLAAARSAVRPQPALNRAWVASANSVASEVTDEQTDWGDWEGGMVEYQGPIQWQEHFTEDGQTFYFRFDTGESLWEMPSQGEVEILSQYQDDEGRWYWYNNTTGESIWSL